MLVFELKGHFEQFGYKFRYKFITKPFNVFSLILAKWLPCCSFDDSCAGQFLRVFISMQQAVLIICSIIFIVFVFFLGFLCTKSKCLLFYSWHLKRKRIFIFVFISCRYAFTATFARETRTARVTAHFPRQIFTGCLAPPSAVGRFC